VSVSALVSCSTPRLADEARDDSHVDAAVDVLAQV
jgi:hypothetical protein